MSNCLFCRSNFQADCLWENQIFYIQIDQFPVSPGHLLIIPKRHCQTIFALKQAEFISLHEAIAQAKKLCHSTQVKNFYQHMTKQKDNPKVAQWSQWALDHWDHPITGYNLGVNNGQSAGQTIFHLHIHLIPRFDDDVPDPTGGVRFVIPSRANYR